MKYLISNGNVVLPNKIIRLGYVEITDEVITNIFESITSDQLVKYDFVLDAKGQFVSPGFIDLHNHGALGYDAMDASLESIKKIADYHLSNGVTSFLATPMTGTYEKITKALLTVNEYIEHQCFTENQISSEVLGNYLEGPYFAVSRKGAQPEVSIRKPSVDEMMNFISSSRHHIKVLAMAPEREDAEKMFDFLNQQKITIALGHTNATYEEAMIGISHHARLATHLYNGMRPFTHREPGIIGAVLTNDSVYAEIIADMLHLHKAAIDLAVRAKGFDRICLISDAIRATGMPDGEYDLGGQNVVSKDGIATLNGTTLAGSTLNLLKAVKNVSEVLHYPLYEVVKMASLNPAKSIEVDALYGSIEVSKYADIILFDEQFKLNTVIKKGHIKNF